MDKATAYIGEQDQGVIGVNCLMEASGSFKRLDIVQLLVAHGANLDLTWEPAHKTALHEAAYFSPGNNFPIVKLLLKAGAKKDIKDSNQNLNAADFARNKWTQGGKPQMGDFIDGFKGMYEDHLER